MKFLIDSDWSIQCLHGVESVIHRVDELSPEGIGLSLVSLAELYEGILYSANPKRDEEALYEFLDGVFLVEIDSETCHIFAKERGRLRAEGNLIDDFDLMIGATAIRHDLTLLTNNRRHFTRIDGLQIVSI